MWGGATARIREEVRRQMGRIILAVAAVAMIALPSILICLKWRVATPLRLLLAGLAFTAPLILIWAIHLVPSFNGEAPTNPSFWRGIGILLSTATLIIPWLIYTAVRDRADA